MYKLSHLTIDSNQGKIFYYNSHTNFQIRHSYCCKLPFKTERRESLETLHKQRLLSLKLERSV